MDESNKTTIGVIEAGDALRFEIRAKSNFTHAAEFLGVLLKQSGGSLRGVTITLIEDRQPAAQQCPIIDRA